MHGRLFAGSTRVEAALAPMSSAFSHSHAQPQCAKKNMSHSYDWLRNSSVLSQEGKTISTLMARRSFATHCTSAVFSPSSSSSSRFATGASGSSDAKRRTGDIRTEEVLHVEAILPSNDGPAEGEDEEDWEPTESDSLDERRTSEVVQTLDPFARAKILNFIKRMTGGDTASPDQSQRETRTSSFSSASASASHGQSSLAEIRQVQTFGDDTKGVTFYARIALPLPSEYGERWGEGMAATEKDAEAVAMMHAERVIDALGFPLFQLTSKQKRHAEAARQAGRQAPLPDESPKPPSTPSPPRLDYVKEGARQAAERRLQLDKVSFTNVSVGAFTPMKQTLASPYFIDAGSIRRIKLFFSANHKRLQHYCRIIPLHETEESKAGHPDKRAQSRSNATDSRSGGRSASSGTSAQDLLFLCQIKLPVDSRFGERIAMGKAPGTKDAYALACMHAELIIDALGVALYPSNPKQQRSHAEECAKVGRWCATLDAPEYRYTAISPPALQLTSALHGSAAGMSSFSSSSGAATSTTATTTTVVDASNSVESVLMQHTRAVASFTHVRCIRFVDPEARDDLLEYLAVFQSTSTSAAAASRGRVEKNWSSPFIVEKLGIPQHFTHRASIVVPVAPLGNSSSSLVDKLPELSSFVAIGIGSSENEAEVCASMHALEVLGTLRRAVFNSNPQRQRAFAARIHRHGGSAVDPVDTSASSADPERSPVSQNAQPIRLDASFTIPSPFKLLTSLIGRISVPGRTDLSDASRRRRSSPSGQEGSNVPDVEWEEVQAARATVPKEKWSLEPDTEDGAILVSPHADPKDARSYLHTLASIREPDHFALIRLRDYVERNGKSLEVSIHRTSKEMDGEMVLYRSRVVLPVPLQFAECVALGEGYSPEDADGMCAVHAELLLDAAGIAFYDHEGVQSKHASTARSLGRYANGEGNSDNGSSGASRQCVNPPPALVRKEHKDSVFWINYCKRQSSTNARGRPDQDLHTASNGTDIKAEGQTGRGSAVGTRDTISLTGAEDNDDRLCDISTMTRVHSTEVHRAALKLFQTYAKKHGRDMSQDVRQYNVMHPQFGAIHRCIVEIPLPSCFGRRFAVGCASSRRSAFFICCMHGVRVLDALGIPIYSDYRQNEYARIARAKGRYAPLTGDPIRPANTPTPPGLLLLTGGPGGSLEAPEEPSIAQMKSNSHVWPGYVAQCKTFIAKAKDQEVYDALFVHNRTMRSGVGVEDATLDVVEAQSINMHSKSNLARVCASVGLPVPPLMRFETIGKHPHRKFYVVTEVVGTPYTARGIGDDKNTALTRASMHYECILNTLSLSAGLSGAAPLQVENTAGMQTKEESEWYGNTPPKRSGPGSSPLRPLAHSHASTGTAPVRGDVAQTAISARRSSAYFDVVKRDFTTDGKEAIIELYAAIHPPFLPLKRTSKERSVGPPGAGSKTVYVSLLELEDETGLRVTGKGEHVTSASESYANSVADIFRQLQGKSTFQSVIHLVKTTPALRADALTVIELSDRNSHTVLSVCERTPIRVHSMETLLSSYLPISMEPLAKLGGGSSNECETLALLAISAINGKKEKVAVMGETGAKNDADRATSSTYPLTFSLSVRKNLPMLGLALLSQPGSSSKGAHNRSDGGGASEAVTLELNELGLTVAILTAYLAWPTHIQDSGAFSLQLSKLLIGGFVFGCLPAAIEAAAALAGEELLSHQIAGGAKRDDFPDRAACIQAQRKRIISGASQLKTALLGGKVKETKTIEDGLCALAEMISKVNELDNNTNSDYRLPLALAYASFPAFFIPRAEQPSSDAGSAATSKSAAPDETKGTLVIESRDHDTRTVRAELRSEAGAQVFSVFGTSASRSKHTTGVLLSPSACEIPVLGALFARELHANNSYFKEIEDIRNILVIADFIPIATRSALQMRAILRLQDVVSHHLSTLSPLSPQLLDVVDEFVLNKRTAGIASGACTPK